MPLTLKEQIDQLAQIQEESGYEPGWVVHQLEEITTFSTYSLDDWKYLASKLGYSSGWAWHRHREHSGVTSNG